MKMNKCVGFFYCLPVICVASLYAFLIWNPVPLIAETDPAALAARQAAMGEQGQRRQSGITVISDKDAIRTIRMFEEEGKPILDRKDIRYRELMASFSQSFTSSPLDFQEAWQRVADTNTPSGWRSMVIECSPVLLPVLSVATDDSLRRLVSIIGSGAEPMVKSAAIGASETIIANMFTGPDFGSECTNAISDVILKTCATLTGTVRRIGNMNAQDRKQQTDLLVSGLSSLTRILQHTRCNDNEIRLAVVGWGTAYQQFDFESILCFIRLLKFGLGVPPDDAIYAYAMNVAQTPLDKKMVMTLRNAGLPDQDKRTQR
jgi:hypothetical protein